MEPLKRLVSEAFRRWGSSPAGGTFGNRQRWRFSFILQRFWHHRDSLRFNPFPRWVMEKCGQCVGKMWHIVPETFRRYTVGHYKPYDTD